MTTLAVIVFLALAAIAALHVAWGFGMHWPALDERDLVALVVGQTGRTRMPTALGCFGAAVAVFIAGLLALAAVDLVRPPGPPMLVTAASALATAIFAGRGIAAYLPAWRRRFSQAPFATLDRGAYGPLCLLFALAFALLVLHRVGDWA